MTASARADFPWPEQENVEVMKEAQGAIATVIGRNWGPDGTSPISFTSVTDVPGKSFSFTSAVGAQYLGQAISVQGSGVYNGVSGQWDITSSVTLGGDAPITGGGTGSFNLAADGRPGNFDWSWWIFDFHSWVIYPGSSAQFSELTWQFTISGTVILQGKATDKFDHKTGRYTDWVWAIAAGYEHATQPEHGDFTVLSTGTVDRDTWQGDFTVAIYPPSVPAVSEWGMAVLALVVLTAGTIAIGRKRRWLTS